MHRRLAAILLTVIALLPGAALADVAPMPTVLHVDGEASAITARGVPDHASYRLRNTSNEAIEMFVFRAILRVDGTNVPMEVTSIQTDARAVEGRTVRVPANGQVRVTVFFAMPERYASRTSWEVELRANPTGGFVGWETSPARITRARREPSRARKWITGPKDLGTTPRGPRT